MNTNTAQENAKLIAVDFKKALRKSYQRARLGKDPIAGVYQDPQKPNAFYWRPFREDGSRPFLKLKSVAPRFAKIEADDLYKNLAMSKRGLAKSPFEKAHSVAWLCEFYLESGCPRRNTTTKRIDEKLEQEIARVKKIMEWPGAKRPGAKLSLQDCDRYFEWRQPTIRGDANDKTRGARMIEVELVTLSSVLRWAARNSEKTGITVNPIGADRPRYTDSSKIKHCRDFQPESGDELHRLARYFFSDPKSEVLGWQLLFEGMIGQRTHEILKLRNDAKCKTDPGFIECDPKSKKQKRLWLFRSQSSKGTYEFADIHPALLQCLEAHKVWHAKRFPNSHWFFPGRVNPKSPVDKTSLTHALCRATKALGLPHRTSHGLRSFSVNVMRSNGMPDAEVALRHGHKSPKLVVTVYGKISPEKLSYLPSEDLPAWSQWLATGPIEIQSEFGF